MIGAQVCTQKWTRTQRFSYSYRRLSLWNTPISHLNLVCTENISKNNRGRLEQRKIDAKQVVHHSNTTNPDRCFKKYMLSTDATPPPTPIHITAENIGILTYSNSQDIYHSFWTQHSQPNSEATMQKAGIPGFKTNHSLCVTSANEVVSEWNATYTMSRTGHRSVQGV